jgi:MIP family channel proteins
MQKIYLIYLHSFYNTPINYTCIVHLISLSHAHLAARSKVKYLVEIVGTFVLVYAVCTAATVYSGPNFLVGIVGLDKLSTIGVGLVAAFVVIAITYATAYRSGAQINPAVTIALLATGKIRAKEAALFIACQILGAVLGAAVVYSMFGGTMAASLTLPADNNVIRALILETVMTFTAVYVILTTLHNIKNKMAYAVGLLAIGFAFGFNVILGGNVSGASMNPARSFGPALLVWNFDYQWIYWVAPILGGLIASGLYRVLHKDLDLP